MTPEQEALVVEHIPLARFLAGRYAKVLGFDDSFAEACVGLCKAALGFDRAKGKFSAYAGMRINGALLDELRKRAGGRYHYDRDAGPTLMSLDEFIEKWGAAAFADSGPLPEQQAEDNEIKRRVFEAMATLSARDAAVIGASYLDDMPLSAIARRLGVNDSRVSQLRKRALSRLRPCLADLE
jgi:RNA polymerase sigma factor for flagellar operon FliA